MVKRIWSYWHGSKPNIVIDSIKSWKKHLPDWEITILDADTVGKYPIEKPNSYDSLTRTTQSDVIRLSLLYIYGGLWLDASVFLTENLDWLQEYAQYPYYGFKLKNSSYIESWFLWVPISNNSMIYTWLKILNSFLDKSHVVPPNNYCTIGPNRYEIYEAFCYLMKSNPKFAKTFKTIPLSNAESYFYNKRFGPFIPLKMHSRLIKFTKDHRRIYKWTAFPIVYYFILACIVLVIICLVIVRQFY